MYVVLCCWRSHLPFYLLSRLTVRPHFLTSCIEIWFPALRKLLLRELDLLMIKAPVLPELTPRYLELSQSKGRHVAGDIKTLLPKGVLFDTGRGSLVTGYEKLRMQGVWV